MNWKIILCAGLLLPFFCQLSSPSQGPKKKPIPPPAIWKFKLFLEPVKLDAKEDPLEKLLVERYNEIVEEYKQAGAGGGGGGLEPMERALQATLDFRENPKRRLALLKPLLAQARYYEKFKKEDQDHLRAVSPGLEKSTFDFFHRALQFRLAVEIQILRTERELTKKEKNK